MTFGTGLSSDLEGRRQRSRGKEGVRHSVSLDNLPQPQSILEETEIHIGLYQFAAAIGEWNEDQ